MSKRRVFDIDFPEAEPEAGTPAPASDTGAEARRGPMATAIAENAQALSARAQAEAAIRAENDALAHEHVRLKRLGLIVDQVPLSAIRTTKLTRDRALDRDAEIDELKASIKAVGLSNPIRVEEVAGGFELVQGFRRLTAYRELLSETGDADTWGAIPAGLIARGETLEGLYRRMVDENLVRRDISFAEMAELALSYAADTGTAVEAAVDTLYASAGRQKRIYIRNFATLIGRLGSDLRHGAALPRDIGLTLFKRIERIPGTAAQIRRALAAAPDRDAVAEVEILRGFAEAQVTQDGSGAPMVTPDAQPTDTPARSPGAKTVVRLARPEGIAKCSATDGRVELRLDRDFSNVSRQRLEVAVEFFLNALDDTEDGT